MMFDFYGWARRGNAKTPGCDFIEPGKRRIPIFVTHCGNISLSHRGYSLEQQ